VWCNCKNKCEFAVKVTSFVLSDEMLKAQLQTKRIGQTKEAIWQKCIHVCIINLHTHTHKCERAGKVHSHFRAQAEYSTACGPKECLWNGVLFINTSCEKPLEIISRACWCAKVGRLQYIIIVPPPLVRWLD
jgi:hypothetical protein